QHVPRLLDDADHAAVTARVRAQQARVLLGEVATPAAETHALADRADRVREAQHVLPRRAQHLEREPLRARRAEAGALLAPFGQELEVFRGVHGGGWVRRAR